MAVAGTAAGTAATPGNEGEGRDSSNSRGDVGRDGGATGAATAQT